VRPARALVSLGRDRARLAGIGSAMDRLFHKHQTHRQWILPNLPPAVVHHVRLTGAVAGEPIKSDEPNKSEK
ncbi:MAG TPA: hypothetical protein VHY20_10435, partial [Pirellulales bacterium]|nr:hypothetical protein [Pirellulales bacterium]